MPRVNIDRDAVEVVPLPERWCAGACDEEETPATHFVRIDIVTELVADSAELGPYCKECAEMMAGEIRGSLPTPEEKGE